MYLFARTVVARPLVIVTYAIVAAMLILIMGSGCSLKRRAYWYSPKMAEPKASALPREPLLRLRQPNRFECEDCISIETLQVTQHTRSYPIRLCAAEDDLLLPTTTLVPITSDLEPVASNSETDNELQDSILEESIPVSTERIPIPVVDTEEEESDETVHFVFDAPSEADFGSSVLVSPVVDELAEEVVPLEVDQLQIAETYYALAVDADDNVDESAMNMYFDALSLAWKYLENAPAEKVISYKTGRAWEIYHSATARLVHIAACTGHIDPKVGLKIPANGGYRILTLEYVDFPWTADDFNEYHVVGHYSSKFLKTKHKRHGLGVPMVVVRNKKPDDRWLPRQLPFAVTAIIRPSEDLEAFDATNEAMAAEGHIEQVAGSLQLFNPKVRTTVEFRCEEVALASDTSAAYAYMLTMTDPEKQGTLHHHQPPKPNPGLFMMEPHQPGKIPVVFVHGLLSESNTWVSMANELDAYPELSKRYEIWAFQYDYEKPFLESAATLREQLNQACYAADPSGFDRPLRQMVLVGHSMGGLIAKLQVVDSGRTLWQHAAFQSYETLQAPQSTANLLHRAFFFQKSQYVNRVVFIGTPHQGSSWARRFVGRTASRIMANDSTTPEEQAAHKQLLELNPAMFRKEIRRRIPTSVDLLDPDSMILRGMRELEVPEQVHLHSIVGNGYWSIHDGASDGVVPVTSARLPGVETEVLISSMHSNLNKQPAVVNEVLRILSEHAAGVPAWAPPVATAQK
ncbi:MAG: hypothetical protein COA78_11345 [Blastopirellula sp.]|nr:MAG: hypothetical protein COA78_11345 [Blastopirellula sp.]